MAVFLLFLLFLQGTVFVEQVNAAPHDMMSMDADCDDGVCAGTSTPCVNHCLFSPSASLSASTALPIVSSIILFAAALVAFVFLFQKQLSRPTLLYTHSSRKQLLSVMKLE